MRLKQIHQLPDGPDKTQLLADKYRQHYHFNQTEQMILGYLRKPGRERFETDNRQEANACRSLIQKGLIQQVKLQGGVSHQYYAKIGHDGGFSKASYSHNMIVQLVK